MGFILMPGMKPCRFSNSGIKKFRDQCPGTFQQISNDAEGHELAIPAQATATLISPGCRSRKARHFKYIHKKAPKIIEAFLAVRTGLELTQSRNLIKLQYTDNNQVIINRLYY